MKKGCGQSRPLYFFKNTEERNGGRSISQKCKMHRDSIFTRKRIEENKYKRREKKERPGKE